MRRGLVGTGIHEASGRITDGPEKSGRVVHGLDVRLDATLQRFTPKSRRTRFGSLVRDPAKIVHTWKLLLLEHPLPGWRARQNPESRPQQIRGTSTRHIDSVSRFDAERLRRGLSRVNQHLLLKL